MSDLAAALASHDQRRTPYSDLTIGPIVAAARRWLALTPETCQMCIETPGTVDVVAGFADCPSCHGRGTVYKAETVRHLQSGVIGSRRSMMSDHDFTVAVLDALQSIPSPEEATK